MIAHGLYFSGAKDHGNAVNDGPVFVALWTVDTSAAVH